MFFQGTGLGAGVQDTWPEDARGMEPGLNLQRSLYLAYLKNLAHNPEVHIFQFNINVKNTVGWQSARVSPECG